MDKELTAEDAKDAEKGDMAFGNGTRTSDGHSRRAREGRPGMMNDGRVTTKYTKHTKER